MWNTHTLKILSCTFMLTVLCGMTPPASTAMAAATDVLEPIAPLGSVEKTAAFEYKLEGRPDPFVPFLTEKATTAQQDPNEIIDDGEGELSGMQKFEPGQLTLVAVMESTSQKIAMVEDVTGKGYILNEGTPIGRRGIVTQIDPQQGLIVETARTRAGKDIKTTVTMRLKKEGEQ